MPISFKSRLWGRLKCRIVVFNKLARAKIGQQIKDRHRDVKLVEIGNAFRQLVDRPISSARARGPLELARKPGSPFAVGRWERVPPRYLAMAITLATVLVASATLQASISRMLSATGANSATMAFISSAGVSCSPRRRAARWARERQLTIAPPARRASPQYRRGGWLRGDRSLTRGATRRRWHGRWFGYRCRERRQLPAGIG